MPINANAWVLVFWVSGFLGFWVSGFLSFWFWLVGFRDLDWSLLKGFVVDGYWISDKPNCNCLVIRDLGRGVQGHMGCSGEKLPNASTATGSVRFFVSGR
ncbi:hypothetical protein DND58_08120 [Pseudomonas syringae pv. pisi]|nr:hypothetical protein DND58_08120 [Pseudomonas syringae pv. pisi]